MNRTELVKSMAEKMETSQKVADSALTALIDSITDALKDDDKVTLVGFGTFELRDRAARKGKNPQTGEEIEIKASKSPAFKVSKAYRSQFNEE